jgi:hypothetical protein
MQLLVRIAFFDDFNISTQFTRSSQPKVTNSNDCRATKLRASCGPLHSFEVKWALAVLDRKI